MQSHCNSAAGLYCRREAQPSSWVEKKMAQQLSYRKTTQHLGKKNIKNYPIKWPNRLNPAFLECSNIAKYYYNFKQLFLFEYILKCNLFLWCKAEFSASLLQSTMSHDPSEIILICWFEIRACQKLVIFYAICIRRSANGLWVVVGAPSEAECV